MRIFLLLILLSYTPAFAAITTPKIKIVFNDGEIQQVSEVDNHPKSGVKVDAEIVWDERTDGPLPKDAPPVGYMERYEAEEEVCLKTGPDPRVCEQWSEEKRKVAKLRESAALKAAFEKRKSDKDKDDTDKSNLKTALKAIKAKLDSDVAPTAAEQRKILKVLAEQCLKLN